MQNFVMFGTETCDKSRADMLKEVMIFFGLGIPKSKKLIILGFGV